ncbi:endonuclease/exonuclease/phosphatase family protein [Streptomyces boninensis]|uniref:endonuclease/exonuclease/phosphatase family protein n=1 Tax=Streptomyces boninensis TaxID=2039455 RepID=UPI003B20D883
MLVRRRAHRPFVVGLAAAALLTAGGSVTAQSAPAPEAPAAEAPGEDDCDGKDPAAQPSAAPGDALRVATYNIHFGIPAGADDTVPGTDDLDGTAAAIRAQNADVIGLQEVHHKDAWHGDQPTALAAKLKDLYPYAKYHTNSENNSGGHTGEAGNMLLSKHPIKQEKHLPLPEGEHVRRGLHGIQIDVGGTPVWVYTTHYSAGYDAAGLAQREGEARATIEALGSAKQPVVLTGDFNARPYDRLMPWFADAGWVDSWTALHRGDAGCTFPADKPIARIDYAYASPTLDIAAAAVPQQPDSDHRALVVDFKLPAKPVDKSAGVVTAADGQSGNGNLTTYKDGTARLRVCDTKADGYAVRATGYDPATNKDFLTRTDPQQADSCYSATGTAPAPGSAALRVCLIKSGEPPRDCRTERLG